MHSSGADAQAVSHQAYLASNKIDVVKAKIQTAKSHSAVKQKKAVKKNLQHKTLEQQQQISVVKANPTIGRKMRQRAQDLNFVTTARGQVLTVDTSIYSDDGTQLTPAGLRKSLELAAWMEANPTKSILIEGYTQNRGDSERNLSLSQERASTLRRALIRQGVADNRVGLYGYGEDFPYTTNETATGRARNERMEIVASSTTAGIPVSRYVSNQRPTTLSNADQL